MESSKYLNNQSVWALPSPTSPPFFSWTNFYFSFINFFLYGFKIFSYGFYTYEGWTKIECILPQTLWSTKTRLARFEQSKPFLLFSFIYLILLSLGHFFISCRCPSGRNTWWSRAHYLFQLTLTCCCEVCLKQLFLRKLKWHFAPRWHRVKTIIVLDMVLLWINLIKKKKLKILNRFSFVILF